MNHFSGTAPDVAVITRTKNRPLLLQRAMESVLDQTHENWVHVIVNDGGTEEPVNHLAERYAERYFGRLIVIYNPTSVGMEAASNIGIRASQSNHVIIHDDDDSWERTFIEHSLARLQWQKNIIPTTRGVMCHTTLINEHINGDDIIQENSHSFNGWVKAVSLSEMIKGNFIVPICFLFERAALDEIGYFNEHLPVLGDWEFNLRFLSRYEIALLGEHLANYHHRPQSKNIYSNSVFGGGDKHTLFGAVLRNELLRQDMASGKPGIGFLVNFSQQLAPLHDFGRYLGMVQHTLRPITNNIIVRAVRRIASLIKQGKQ